MWSKARRELWDVCAAERRLRAATCIAGGSGLGLELLVFVLQQAVLCFEEDGEARDTYKDLAEHGGTEYGGNNVLKLSPSSGCEAL